MDGSSVTRLGRNLSIRVLAVVFGVIALLVAGVMLAVSHLRGPLIRYAAAQTGRQIRVEGALDVHVFSLNPQVIAERVAIGNPRWMPPGSTAEIGRLSLVFDLPLFGHSFGIHRLEMDGTTLHLVRDASGHANWQWTEPGKGDGKGPPLIRSLAMQNARVELDDARRHLRFDGTVSAYDARGPGDVHPLRIEGAGQLNGRAANLAINGDPLAGVRREQPYRFAFSADSGGSRLSGRGSVPHPFDFRSLDAAFEATGEDMKDLYFLTGLSLPDTGTYRLTGKVTRQETHFEYSDLAVTSGRSDLHGTLSVETSDGRTRFDADLNSKLLRVSDLGARAAGRAPEPQAANPFLLPDTAFRLNGMRGSDGVVKFHAQGLDIGPVSLHAAAAKLTIDHGVLTVAPLSAALAEGKITGEVSINATHDVPTVDMDLRVANLGLSQFGPVQPPPLDGVLQARLGLKGRGHSIHELAASANGTVTAVLPHGAIRASLAELGGIDFRGLGLMLMRNKEETGIRCGVASFQVQDGTLTTRSLVVDTDPVLITGEGTIHLDSEALDLALRGRPKSPRLRLRAPIVVHGTLRHPSVALGARMSAVQAGEAVALGMLLTPVAAVLAFVDPGLAKDADCAALLAEAKTDRIGTRRP